MAEMAVSFAVDQLVPLLTKEANLLRGIHKEFADIKAELQFIQAFLKDAERRAATAGENPDEGIKIWVKQVMEAAFRIEDIIDEYMIYVGQQPRDPGCADVLTKIAHLIKTLLPRRRIASEIQDIKSFVRGIKERSTRYSFQIQSSFEKGSSSSGGSQDVQWHDPRMAAFYIEDAEFVGFEAPRNELIGWLTEGRKERTVISVVGMGGRGKTTLAKKVFDNQKVVGHFDCKAWITVSQSYTAEGLLREMLQKFGTEKEKALEMDRNSLTNEVKNYLQQKRYIVVFDDVWNILFWDVIEFALVDNKNGSRIFITTRNNEVAMTCKRSSFVQVHELQPLTEEESLELFHKKAFRFDFNGCCPDDLVDISSKIVKKCKGLPLAIVAIGGLLSCKEKTALEWERFSCNLSSELEKDSHLSGITKIIGFSYDDLPYNLKPCFLYFGMYPEDYEVRSNRLIWQWIAEGFVKHEKGKTLEEVAEQYLTELIGRSLVQVSSFNIQGKVKYCRVHDITREMILRKCKDLNFGRYISGDDGSTVSGIARRQSIATSSGDFIESTELSHVRSLFFFLYGEIEEDFVTQCLKKYKLLKVLHFAGVTDLDVFPKQLGNLIHLKYLFFRGFYIKDLPRSIGKLQNLETLDVRRSNLEVIIMPKEICKLKKLRHLLGYKLNFIKGKDGIGGMTSLQTLKEVVVSAKEDGVKTIKELKKLRQLRKVGLLIDIGECDESGVCSLLNEIKQLEKKGIVPESTNDLNWVSSPPKPVLKLLVQGKLNKLPEQVQELHNLVKLVLWNTELLEEPLKSLKNLPNLLSLVIGFKAYLGEGLDFEEGGFQNLKELYLEFLPNLKSIMIENGAMSSLKKLTLDYLMKVERVPSGIQYLDKLQHLKISRMPKELKEKISADGGEDHWIINHVPRVDIF